MLSQNDRKNSSVSAWDESSVRRVHRPACALSRLIPVSLKLNGAQKSSAGARHHDQPQLTWELLAVRRYMPSLCQCIFMARILLRYSGHNIAIDDEKGAAARVDTVALKREFSHARLSSYFLSGQVPRPVNAALVTVDRGELLSL